MNIQRLPKSFWINKKSKEYSILLIKCLYEEILDYSMEDIKNLTNFKLFTDYKLNGMIQFVFNNSLYEAINATYPDCFKIWEISVVQKSYWTIETGIEATKWLIEEKCNWFDIEKRIKPTANIFIKYKLGGMLQLLFNNSPYEAINTAYPGLFMPWELGIVPQNYWSLETGIISTKWLMEEKLDFFNDKSIKIKKALFIKYGLVGMLNAIFNGSTYNAINTAYPGMFMPWEVCSTPRNYWTKENSISAIKWLIEEKLEWLTDDVIIDNIRKKTFSEYGLGGLISMCYNCSPFLALDATYPGRFKEEEFRRKE